MARPRKSPVAAGDTTKGANQVRPVRGSGAPEKPADLPALVAAEWDRVTALLGESGLLDRSDGNLIRIYCETYVRRAEAVRLSNDLPEMYVTNPNGSIGMHPLFKMIDKTTDQLSRMSGELFMSPGSRVRQGVGEPVESAGDRVFGEELARFALARPELPKLVPIRGADDEPGDDSGE